MSAVGQGDYFIFISSSGPRCRDASAASGGLRIRWAVGGPVARAGRASGVVAARTASGGAVLAAVAWGRAVRPGDQVGATPRARVRVAAEQSAGGAGRERRPRRG